MAALSFQITAEKDLNYFEKNPKNEKPHKKSIY